MQINVIPKESILRLSATSIKDSELCRRCLWYRRHNPKAAKLSKAVIFGSITHEAVEKHTQVGVAIRWAEEEWERRMGSSFAKGATVPPKNFNKMLENYYYVMLPTFRNAPDTRIEWFFDIPWKHYKDKSLNIHIVGKIDRIANKCIYDWKTSSRAPSYYTKQDIQFYIYDWAYKQEFGRYPEQVIYGFLQRGKLYPIEIHEASRKNLVNVINKAVDVFIEDSPSWLSGYHCGNCFYREQCKLDIEQMSKEVAK